MGSHPIVPSGPQDLRPKIKLDTPFAPAQNPAAVAKARVASLLDRSVATTSDAIHLGPLSQALQSHPQQNLSLTFRSLDKVTQEKIRSILGASTLHSLFSLSEESNEGLFYQDLYSLGQESQKSGNLSAASLIFTSMSDDSEIAAAAPQPLREKAFEAVQIFSGAGPQGRQLEFQLSRFADDVASPVGIAAMGTAGLTYGSVRLATFGGLSRIRALPWLTRGWGAHGLAFTAGLGAESAAFVGVHRGLNTLMGHHQGSEGISVQQEFLATLLILSALKISGGFTRAALGKTPAQASWWHKTPHVLAPQAAMYGSIVGTQYLEGQWGWRPPSDNLALGGLVTLLHFNAVGKLMERSLGRPYANMVGDIHRRSEILRRQLFQPWAKNVAVMNQPMLAVAEGPAQGSSIMMMSASGNGGRPKGQGAEEPRVILNLKPESEPPTVPDSNPEDYDVPLSPREMRNGMKIADRYQIDKILGNGAMGVVYEARHMVLGNSVAIKVLRSELARYPLMNERFLTEARAASRLQSPHIIKIHDFGELPDGAAYYVMEHLNGEPISNFITEGIPFKTPKIIHLAQQIAKGMAAAHESGVIHRDLKPENILLVAKEKGGEKDVVKILDFGLAKILSSKAKLTINNDPMGTPAYMSPEQINSTKIDHRSDIYSLGAILYEMATGKVPFEAASLQGLYAQHMNATPMPLQLALEPAVAKNFKTSPGLEAIIMKCLEKNPEKRYQSMDEIHADLELLKVGKTPMALVNGNSSPPLKMAWRISDFFSLRNLAEKVPSWKIIGGASGILALGGLGGYLISRTDDNDEAHTLSPGLLPSGNSGIPGLLPTPSSSVDISTPPINPSSIPVAEDQKTVTLKVIPADAHVYLHNTDLGTSPLPLVLEKGETMEVEIKRRGYKSEKVTLDGSKPMVSITLKYLGGGRHNPPTSNPTGKPTGTQPGDWVVKPWD